MRDGKVQESHLGLLFKARGLTRQIQSGLNFCVSNKLLNGTDTIGPWITLQAECMEY